MSMCGSRQSNDARCIQHIEQNLYYLYIAMSELVNVRVHGVISVFDIVSVSVVLVCVAARKLNVRKPEWIQSTQRTRRSLTHAVSLRCRRQTLTWKSMQRSEHNVIFSDMFSFCALNLSFTYLF